jgi:hypothetical protein
MFTNSGSQQGPHIGIWKNVDHDINSKGAQAVQGHRLHFELAAALKKMVQKIDYDVIKIKKIFVITIW